MIQFAQQNGKIRHVTEVPRGLQCECTCVGCGQQLIAKRGQQVIHHFAHLSRSSCDGEWEGITHSEAKKVIIDSGYVFVPVQDAQFQDYSHDAIQKPELEKVEFEEVLGEVSSGKYRIDIQGVHRNGKKLAIEIAVSHPCTDQKCDYYRRHRIPSLEIFLQKMEKGFTLKQFRQQVLKTAPRIWIYNRRFDKSRFLEKRRLEQYKKKMQESIERYGMDADSVQQQVQDVTEQAGGRPLIGVLQIRNLKRFHIPSRMLCIFDRQHLPEEYHHLAIVEERYSSRLSRFQGRKAGFFLLPDVSSVTLKSGVEIPFPKARIAWIEGLSQDTLSRWKYHESDWRGRDMY